MKKRILELDDTRPIHYEGDYGNAHWRTCIRTCTPAVDNLAKEAVSEDTRPYFLCEYGHAMGLGPGSLKDYWDADLRQQAPGRAAASGSGWTIPCIHQPLRMASRTTPTAAISAISPNDGNFCVDALNYPDRTPHTGLIEY